MTGGNDRTNLDRDRPYDYVLTSLSMTNRLAPVGVGGQSFSNGLVFDSRVFTPLEALPPVQPGDSTNGQHMAVMKGFQISWVVTNWIDLPRPELKLGSGRRIEWSSPSNLIFRVEASVSLTNTNGWVTLESVTSPTTNYSFTPSKGGASPLFYRVTCP